MCVLTFYKIPVQYSRKMWQNTFMLCKAGKVEGGRIFEEFNFFILQPKQWYKSHTLPVGKKSLKATSEEF